VLGDIGVFICIHQVLEEVRRVTSTTGAAALVEYSRYRLGVISEPGVDIGEPVRRRPKEAAVGIQFAFHFQPPISVFLPVPIEARGVREGYLLLRLTRGGR